MAFMLLFGFVECSLRMCSSCCCLHGSPKRRRATTCIVACRWQSRCEGSGSPWVEAEGAEVSEWADSFRNSASSSSSVSPYTSDRIMPGHMLLHSVAAHSIDISAHAHANAQAHAQAQAQALSPCPCHAMSCYIATYHVRSAKTIVYIISVYHVTCIV